MNPVKAMNCREPTGTRPEIGQRVNVIGRWFAGPYAPLTGRTGVITKLCDPPFSDCCYVQIDRRPRERTIKEFLFEFEKLEILDEAGRSYAASP